MTTPLKKAFAEWAKALRDTGYKGFTAKHIAASHAKWVAGAVPAGFIDEFAFETFAGHPDLFGAKGA